MAPSLRSTRVAGLLLAATVAGGCFSTETNARYPDDLYHPDYVKRSRAVAEFAEQKDKAQLPEAFRLLLDDDANIRLVAYSAIHELSPGGEDFGYRPYLPRDVRFGIVARWQAWWVKSAEGAPVTMEALPEDTAAAAETGGAEGTTPPAEGGNG